MADDKDKKKEEAAKNVRAIRIAYHPDRFLDKESKEKATEIIQGVVEEFDKKYNDTKRN